MDKNEATWDAIVSDHMNDSEDIVQRIKECGLFEQVYHVKSLELTKN